MAEQKLNRRDVQLIDQQRSHKGFFQLDTLRLRHRLFAGGWSEPFSRELFIRGDAVGILLYDADMDSVALVEQFRVGVLGSQRAEKYSESPWILELVAGMVESGESPEQVAEREAIEEADLVVQSLESIGQYYSSPGGSDEYFYLFVGQVDLSSAGGIHGLADEHEDICVHVIPVGQLFMMLQQGDINNAHTLIAAQWLQIHHQRIKGAWSK
jgi:ADP-ribose pyrophosphatase